MPTVTVVPKGTFVEWLRSRGMVGGQNKVPRLFNDRTWVDQLLAYIPEMDRMTPSVPAAATPIRKKKLPTSVKKVVRMEEKKDAPKKRSATVREKVTDAAKKHRKTAKVKASPRADGTTATAKDTGGIPAIRPSSTRKKNNTTGLQQPIKKVHGSKSEANEVKKTHAEKPKKKKEKVAV